MLEHMKGKEHLINLSDAKETCSNWGMCAEDSIAHLLLDERSIDFDAHIKAVNSDPASTWVAGHNDKFKGASAKEVGNYLGTVVDSDWAVQLHPKGQTGLQSDSFPTNFDSSENWPKCASVIRHIRDQANCGSCWAHGTTEALNDRLCIASNGDFQTLLSVSDTTGCCNFVHCMSMGCNGGQVGTPWKWFKNTGVVSGGDFGDNKFCYDYTMPQCNHHVTNPSHKNCEDIKQVAPKCQKSCSSNKSIAYKSDKHQAKSSYGFRSVEDIKSDIMKYGTVTAAFTVYEDFPTYKSGVYQHTSGKALGGHAIKVIGWGNENGTDYWLCVNSWNEDWGDKGTFKIKMGNCGIDGQMHAGLV